MKERIIKVCGFNVSVCDFGYKQFYYPSFNGDAEFEVSAKGFRQLSHYLRNVKYWNKVLQEILNN